MPPVSVLEHVADGWAPPWRWSDHHPGAPLPLAPQVQLGLASAYLAAVAAGDRLHHASTSMRAVAAWTAAVECLWWLAAIEDLLCQVFRQAGFAASDLDRGQDEWQGERVDLYRRLRRADEDGRVMDGLLRLRHRHTHELAMTGRGSARPWSGSWHGGVAYISAGYTWQPRADIRHVDIDDRSKHLRTHYDQHVAGRPLHGPTGDVLTWLSRLLPALGYEFLTIDAPDGDPRDLGSQGPGSPPAFVPLLAGEE